MNASASRVRTQLSSLPKHAMFVRVCVTRSHVWLGFVKTQLAR